MRRVISLFIWLIVIASFLKFCSDNAKVFIDEEIDEENFKEVVNEINGALFEIGKALEQIEHGVDFDDPLKKIKDGYWDTLGEINPDTIIDIKPRSNPTGEVEWAEDPF